MIVVMSSRLVDHFWRSLFNIATLHNDEPICMKTVTEGQQHIMALRRLKQLEPIKTSNIPASLRTLNSLGGKLTGHCAHESFAHNFLVL